MARITLARAGPNFSDGQLLQMADRHRLKTWGPLAAVSLSFFALALDQIMLPLAVSGIIREMDAGVGDIQAAVAFFSLAAAPVYLVGGKLGDILGRRRTYRIGLLLYGFGTFSAIWVSSVSMLYLGWSLLRGLAMGLVLPNALALIIAHYSGARRGPAFGVYGAAGPLATLLGPLFMGWAVNALSWRLPYGFSAALVAVILLLTGTMREIEPRDGVKLDWVGAVLSMLGISALILGLTLASRYGWWQPAVPLSLGGWAIQPFGLSIVPLLMAFGAISLGLLTLWCWRAESRGGQPLFHPSIFRSRAYTTAWLILFLSLALAAALLFMMPILLQEGFGYVPLAAGAAVTVYSLGSATMGLASGALIRRVSGRRLMLAALLVFGAGLAWLYSVFGAGAEFRTLLPPMALVGTGFGVILAQTPNLSLSAVRPLMQGEAGGINAAGQELGVGLGVGGLGSLLLVLGLTAQGMQSTLVVMSVILVLALVVAWLIPGGTKGG